MARALMVLGLLLAAGCADLGDNSSMPTDYGARLAGNWILVEASGAVALDFTGSDYVLGVLATSNGSAVNAELDRGSFVATNKQVTFTPREWTCDGMKSSYTFDYSVTGNSLSLMGSDGILAFAANTATGGSAQIVYGCFDSSGTFTPHPIGPAR